MEQAGENSASPLGRWASAVPPPCGCHHGDAACGVSRWAAHPLTADLEQGLLAMDSLLHDNRPGELVVLGAGHRCSAMGQARRCHGPVTDRDVRLTPPSCDSGFDQGRT